MTGSRFSTLRAQMGDGYGVPVIAVIAQTEDEVFAIRQAGGLPIAGSTTPRDDLVALDASIASVPDVRMRFPVAFMMDTGVARSDEEACALAKDGMDAVNLGTMGYGDNGGTPADRDVAYAVDETSPGTVPVLSGGLNAVRVLGLFENLGHANVVLLVRRGVIHHQGGIAAGIKSLKLASLCRREGGHVFDFAQTHPAFAQAFSSFPEDADQLYQIGRAHV